MLKSVNILFGLLLVLLQGVAQDSGITRYGTDTIRGSQFVNEFGGTVTYPRLSRYGHILHYSPIVLLDSVQTSVSTRNSAALYGNVVFDGWSLVTMRGFDYSQNDDFTTYTRRVCMGTLGQFMAEVSGLEYNRSYYVRSFAANDEGISFSDTASFMVAIGPVVIDTMFQISQTPFSSELELIIEENGGAPLSGEIAIFSDGEFQNSVVSNPVNNVTALSFNSTLSGLSPSTTYFVRAVLTNGVFSDTAYLQMKTPTDLTLSIESDAASTFFLCPDRSPILYRAVLTGTDANKPFYRFFWNVTSGVATIHDSICSVLYDEPISCTVGVTAIYQGDTLFASIVQTLSNPSNNSSLYVCTNEFLNTADATTTGIASIRWVDENENVVATSNSVRLPTGNYRVEGIDGYGCTLRKEVYVGKKKLSCVIAGNPGSNESARFEDGVWKIDSLSDEDGFWYAVTQIGSRCWLRQNLQTRHLPSTHQDLLRTGQDFTPNMRYPDNQINYDPYTMPYTGAWYNWCATMDVASAPYNVSYNFSSQHRGLCPAGWHIPNENEILEMVDTLLKLYYPDVTPHPVSGTSGNLIVAENTPIKYMLLYSCYDSYTNPAYPEIVYDASNLSISPSGLPHKFWLSTLPTASMSAEAVYLSSGSEGVKIGVGIRNATYMPVRCVRNYFEE